MRKNNKINIILPKKIKLRNKSFFSYFEKYVNLIQDTETIYSFNTLASILELPLGICVPMDKICPSLDAASNITQSDIFYDLAGGLTIFNSNGDVSYNAEMCYNAEMFVI